MAWVDVRGSLAAAVGIVAAMLSVGCGHTAAAKSPAAGPSAGAVVERASGYADRPAWANADRPFARDGDRISIVGYLGIRGDQRAEAAFRAADSYARAELVRFLSVRVVSVLEDVLRSDKPGALSERIETSSNAWIESIEPSEHYWERRTAGGDERIHVYSRLDLTADKVADLLARAADLRAADLQGKLRERWDRLAQMGDPDTGATVLPADVFTPSWAKGGDRETSDGFQLVCHGLAQDQTAALALARARCNEKLCRLFGVQITARSMVEENLDGVKAESEVSEQCADVRVVARKTLDHAGDCGPRGCVQWLLQTYPRAAYDEEKKRIDLPKIVRQEVVIKEGDKAYRDPAACEASLRAYGSVDGQSARDFEQRRAHLVQALQVCQGIDGRDAGLFQTLDRLIQRPLASFASGMGDRRADEAEGAAFVFTGRAWRDGFETQRFITDRIQSVLELVTDAIVPMRLLDLRHSGADANAVDAAIREVTKYPYTNQPVSPHHRDSLHGLAMSMVYWHIPYSRPYRDFLLDAIERGRLTCSRGVEALQYLGKDGTLDDREWQAGIAMLRATQARPSTDERRAFSSCIAALATPQPRAQHVEQILTMIVSGEIRDRDAFGTFGTLLSAVPKEERVDMFLRNSSRLTGPAEGVQSLVHTLLPNLSLRDVTPASCERMPAQVEQLLALSPKENASQTSLCACITKGALSAPARAKAIELLSRSTAGTCRAIRDDEMPGGPADASLPVPNSDNEYPVASETFVEEFHRCLHENVPLGGVYPEAIVRGTLVGDRLSNISATVALTGKIRDFRYPDNRTAVVRGTDLGPMRSATQACLIRAVTGVRVVVRTKSAKARRIFVWLNHDDFGRSGVE